MKFNSPKAIKSKLIEIRNEELLNINIYLKDLEEINSNRDLVFLIRNRLPEEFTYLDDEDMCLIPPFRNLSSFCKNAYYRIRDAYIGRKFIENRYHEEISEIEELIEEDIFEMEKIFREIDFERDVSEWEPYIRNISKKGRDSVSGIEKDTSPINEDECISADESHMLEIAYNHSNPNVRSFALGMVEKPHVWLDFLINDPDSNVRLAALYYLFGEEYLENFSQYDYFREIPIEVSFNLDYEKVSEDFGIEEPIFKRHDKLIISKISFENDELNVFIDPENSFEHAVSEISNQDALKAIANSHSQWSVRYIAVNRISDVDYLYDLALNGFEEDAKPKHGILYYPGEFAEGDVLKSVLNRLLFLKDLNGNEYNEFLKELFYSSKDYMIKRYCLSKIEDDEFLANLVNDEADPSFARIIFDRIKDEDYLIFTLLSVLRNPRFDGIHHTCPDEFFINGEMDIEGIKALNEKLGRYDKLDYSAARAKACRMLASMPSETLSRCLRDLSPKLDLDAISGKHFFSDILDMRIADILMDVARGDESSKVRLLAISGIGDKDALRDIALSDEDREVSYHALKRIDDGDFTRDYLLKYGGDPLYLLSNDLIGDQSILADIALNDSWKFSRKEATRNLEDEDLLEHIAKNDPEWIVRAEAVSKIKDKDVLIDIAYNDIDDPVKRDVIRKIDDEDVLIDLLYKDESSDILSLILSRINKQEVICDFAYNHPSWSIREDAVVNVKDNPVLAYIAKNDEDEIVRMAAIRTLAGKYMEVKHIRGNSPDRYAEHLKNRDYFESLVDLGYDGDLESDDNNGNLESDDVNSINNESNGNDEDKEKYEYVDLDSIVLYEDENPFTLNDLLVDLAFNDASEKVREFASSCISDENILFDIAMNDESIRVRLSAIDEIERNELLARIFAMSRNHHIYEKAISKIRYEYVLRKLAGLKSYYGEIWPKDQIVKARLKKLGFKAPNPLPKYEDEFYTGKKGLFRPTENLYEIDPDELIEINGRIMKLVRAYEFGQYDDSKYHFQKIFHFKK